MSEDKPEAAKEELTQSSVENDELKENSAANDADTTKPETSVTTKKPAAKTQKGRRKPAEGNPVRGLPKSGRPWKTPKQKFSTIKKSKHRLPFEKKMELRNELRNIKERSREIKEQRKEAAVQKNQRRIENAERRLANERRSEIVQIIKNPAKLRRMKKKQMRMIEKRDISQVKVV
ncbi:PREDICTED: coiled-coil domain-containing protein 86 [Rhagoletis zephyria]|uniref:coiled-coil domain-containing protein 86 n=1 Tax=Rhagoletis zephyria TaxID=28612 RepID=UPI0008118A1E|nr:PREDICTED: coiled-coil domain-containing protein 86 [Rhagoletis zephyria]